MAKKNTAPGASSSAPVASVRHKDKRKNIPTEELRDFVAEEEHAPKAAVYPRNPDLDPQLVWRGKDEQDRQPLEVPAVPVYIQEKVHPQAIIEDFRRNLPSPQRALVSTHLYPVSSSGSKDALRRLRSRSR